MDNGRYICVVSDLGMKIHTKKAEEGQREKT